MLTNLSAPLLQLGFRCDRTLMQPAANQKSFVRRHEIALNLLEQGGLRMVFATGDHLDMTPGQLTVSWGAIPHRVEWQKDTIILCLCLPLPWVLRWQLPAKLNGALLAGQTLAEADREEGRHDQHMMRRWVKLLDQPTDEQRRVVLLELEARLRRLALAFQTASRPLLATNATKLEQAVQLIAKRFAEPLSVPALAAELGIHPNYLSTLFKRETGQSLSHYLTEYRLAHACALLASTTDKIIDIAYAAGFGSANRFHVLFRRHHGCSPRQYRLTHHPQSA